MDLSGRRESTNVQDRRGQSGGGSVLGGLGGLGGGLLGGGKGKAGCGSIIIIVLLFLIGPKLGIDPMQMIGNMATETAVEQQGDGQPYQGTAEEEELAKFTKQVLASTEDVWTRKFQQMGKQYEAPTLVLYSGSIQTGCGQGTASTGPFYCSADQCVYIDLSFYKEMKTSLGAEGDFAWAYVIAHEVGHHVQYLLGTLGRAHQEMAQLSQTDANRVSVQIELQADFLAGVWGHDEQKAFGSMEKGDLEEALNTAIVIGDDHLQKRAGYNPDERKFTHGTSAQRQRWFRRGFDTGDLSQGDTFAKKSSEL
ncbi:MAG: zinc metallopeptidase [Bacteroidaceae bacterium]|nr:zinc metallopeptidase [Bacteroidaceae bacterium]